MTAFLVCCWSRNCMVDCISSKLMSNSFREVSCFKRVLSLTVTDLSGPGFCPIYIGRFTEAFPQTARLELRCPKCLCWLVADARRSLRRRKRPAEAYRTFRPVAPIVRLGRKHSHKASSQSKPSVHRQRRLRYSRRQRWRATESARQQATAAFQSKNRCDSDHAPSPRLPVVRGRWDE